MSASATPRRQSPIPGDSPAAARLAQLLATRRTRLWLWHRGAVTSGLGCRMSDNWLWSCGCRRQLGHTGSLDSCIPSECECPRLYVLAEKEGAWGCCSV
jgi:hypothetical protein